MKPPRSISRCPLGLYPLGAALFIAVLLAAACGGPSSPPVASARRVVVYSPHGQEMIDQFAQAFRQTHPEVEVVGRFVPTGQILTQLRIDKASPQVDVWWGGTSAFFGQAAAEGLLAPFRPSWAAASEAGRHDPRDFWYAQFLELPAVLFNKNLVRRDEAPATWEALLAPRWTGRLVIREPMDSGTMKSIFCGLVWRLGGPAHDPQPGFEFLKKLDAQTRAYLPNPQALYDRIAKSPEGLISLWNVTDILFQARANGYPFDYRIPQGPAPVWLDPIALVAGAPHPEEAHRFYEFVTSKESTLRMMREHFRLPARADIPRDAWPPELRAINLDPLPIDWAAFDRLQPEWMRQWRQQVRNPEK